MFASGFYGATYMKGFRDPFNVDIDALVELISAVELHANRSAAEAEEINTEIKAASKNATHMCVDSVHLRSPFFPQCPWT
jgi:KUP system potassium uptake protein